jgi:DNA-binding beta-propeller fold protein YncE
MRQFGGTVPPAGAQVLYVANEQSAIVYLFSPSGKNQKPIGTITGFYQPEGMAVDGNGDLYVADSQSPTGSVFVFHAGQTTPYLTLTSVTNCCFGVAVDSQGNVYGADSNAAGPAAIYVWAAGSTTPTSTLTPAFNASAHYVAVDAAGDVFASDGVSEIDEFPAGSTTPIVLRTDQTNAEGLALDGSQNLVVANAGVGFKIYAPPYTGKLSKELKFKHNVYALALNSTDSALWYADITNGYATQLTYPALKKVESTKKGLIGGDLKGIALYPALGGHSKAATRGQLKTGQGSVGT